MPQNLYRSRRNKVFAGVCGGIAEYFKVDPTLVRLAWALAFFVGGSGFILYILAMIIMPESPVEQVKPSTAPPSTVVIDDEDGDGPAVPPPFAASQSSNGNGEEKRRQIFGLILVAIGGYFLLERFFPVFDFHNWWPLILVFIGVLILTKGKGGSR